MAKRKKKRGAIKKIEIAGEPKRCKIGGLESQRKASQERLRKEHLTKSKAFAKEFRAECLEMEKERKARTAQYKAIDLAKRKDYAEFEKSRAKVQDELRKEHLVKHAEYVG